jgi:tRNA-dihydrouridine synthase
MNTILNLPHPVIGLSPMDGITDTAFRQITKKYGNPDILFTEFAHVMGMCFALHNTISTFFYEEIERPIVAQIFGNDPEYFYHAAKIVCALGFDGVDINMGCPAKNVASRGSGASLINNPELAKKIIVETKRGIADWVVDGRVTGLKPKAEKALELQVTSYRKRLETRDWRLEQIDIEVTPKNPPSKGVFEIPPLEGRLGGVKGETNKQNYDNNTTHYSLQTTNSPQPVNSLTRNTLTNLSNGQINLLGEKRIEIPVSVKTRIGYDKPITEQWIKFLSDQNPAWIAVHGRTLKQMYSGNANWDELRKAVECTNLPVLVNGDVKEYNDIKRILDYTGAYGVLIGRATFGNPFVFQPLSMNGEGGSDLSEPGEVGKNKLLLHILLEHAQLFLKYNLEPSQFVQMRKHFGWYVKGFDGAKEMREKLMMAKSLEEVERIVHANGETNLH